MMAPVRVVLLARAETSLTYARQMLDPWVVAFAGREYARGRGLSAADALIDATSALCRIAEKGLS